MRTHFIVFLTALFCSNALLSSEKPKKPCKVSDFSAYNQTLPPEVQIPNDQEHSRAYSAQDQANMQKLVNWVSKNGKRDAFLTLTESDVPNKIKPLLLNPMYIRAKRAHQEHPEVTAALSLQMRRDAMSLGMLDHLSGTRTTYASAASRVEVARQLVPEVTADRTPSKEDLRQRLKDARENAQRRGGRR